MLEQIIANAENMLKVNGNARSFHTLTVGEMIDLASEKVLLFAYVEAVGYVKIVKSDFVASLVIVDENKLFGEVMIDLTSPKPKVYVN